MCAAKADFIGVMPELGPVVISILKEVEKLEGRGGYRILIRSKNVRLMSPIIVTNAAIFRVISGRSCCTRP